MDRQDPLSLLIYVVLLIVIHRRAVSRAWTCAMRSDNTTVRRIVAQIDRDIPLLQILADQAKGEVNRLDFRLTIDAARLFRFRLKDLGHGSHFATPEGDTS